MPSKKLINTWVRRLATTGVVVGLGLSPLSASAQDRYRLNRIDPGTVISVRTNQPIDSREANGRVYTGTVNRDVRGEAGRVAIPRGSTVELIVRTARDNDLILDLDSVNVNGQRFGISTAANRLEAQNDYGIVGSIVGALSGTSGRAIRLPRNSVVTFRVDRPLDLGVADRGYDRGGYHYHDYDRDDRR